ncbi:lysylphosphatidylglycerol synthase-like protein [Ulvibacter sp. MAR_2010_11]|uniref:lysylphosphatidylglycerol synthase domain-containing protein n=1 Tax=Ulvibacter sp. MAR_2010_11 TaxID=1250229 RepID=UPI000CC43FE1|nr:lysylphosphatidylglycerol synthase domain-containing protein [Ulvibacter sp. MAR_2010_11]PKA82589.1 lysylphosphatidylglycerol synthase-like protein [Ulvibacter sp. MAR_2010_11]
MLALSHKSKQYLLVTLKVFVLGITFWYIYSKVSDTNAETITTLTEAIQHKNSWILFVFVGLAGINWILEILKWQTVIAPVKQLTFWEALKQSLMALTTSLATPNRIGDYGAKAYFYAAGTRKKVLLLNFFSNVSQMAVTLIFGILGLLIVISKYSLSFSVLKIAAFVVALTVLFVVGYLFKEKELLIKGLSIKKVIDFIKKLPASLRVKVWFLSLLRYACFTYLFLLLLRYFEVDIAFSQAYPLIFAMYLLVSLIPTLFIFDVVIRGGVAVWLFSLAGVPELAVLCTVLVMWLLNFVIPALLGSFFVVTYKPETV